MIITCPECGFERQVNPDKIPARSHMATCPKCKTKFKFRDLPEEFDFVPDPHPGAVAPKPEDAGAHPEPEAQAHEHPSTEEDDHMHQPNGQDKDRPDLLPGLEDPRHDKNEELWDRLGGMVPPEEQQQREDLPHEEPPVPEWIRKREQQAEEDRLPGDTDTVRPPFEDLEHFGFFPGVLETIKRIAFAPRLFFERMPIGNGVGRPLVFALLLILLHDIFQSIYMYAGIVPLPTFEGEVIQMPAIGMGSQLALTVLFSPVTGAVALFIIAGIYHAMLVMLRAASGGFEATFRGVAYATVPVLLGLIPQVNDILSQIGFVLASSWFMVVVIIAWAALHRTSYLKAGLAIILPPLLMMLIFFVSQGAVPTV